MKIRSIDFRVENLKLTKPYRIAFKTVEHVENLFCSITFDNGIIGYGACNPENEVAFISRNKTLESIELIDQQYLSTISIDHEPWDLIHAVNKSIGDIPTIQTAVELAIWDAFGKKLHKPILEIWGKKVEPLSTSVTIGIMDIEQTLQETKDFLSQGFDHIKIKIGLDPEVDAERIEKLLEKYGSKIVLRADINQGYKLDDYKKFLTIARHLPIELFEQPLRRDQFHELDALVLADRKNIAADESLLHIQDANEIADAQRCGIYNIKIMKCGAWSKVKEIAGLGSRHHIDIMWGCNDESKISIAGAMNMAYACTNTKYLDLDGSFDLAYDPGKNGFEVKNGMLVPVDRPGLGVDLEF